MTVTGGWTAIILAGQRPGADRLAEAFGETYKALIPVGGVPMVARVAETLLAVPAIGRIILLSQEPAVLRPALPDDPRIGYATAGAGIATSIEALTGGEAPWPVFVTTADHPLLSVEMVTAFLDGAGDGDVAVAAVERRTMLARYPETKRTWLRFRDGAWSGANLFALRTPAAAKALALWAEAERDRKTPWKLFRHFGPVLALRAISRTIGFAAAIRAAGRRSGFAATLVPLDDAEAAIDVDKVSDHAMAEAILSTRLSGVTHG
ncbi:molybdenum cofactor guanylyltransferase [Sphingomonas flavalba]|uniref:molybdenum cofactor guanylyltransferase n=1 Tax=Sphingomonas flavalba TaxID=2559804 RepID=UPI00109E08E5|nr:nucleotidyltransferase family protein [Sphingomonas flavalba]